jgi:hypothetical protein
MVREDIDADPKQVVGCERADLPRADAGIVAVRPILLASNLLASSIAMDPGDAAWGRCVFDGLDVDAAVAACAN